MFTKNSNNAINIISKIASGGVIFGSLVLLIVLSGFTGLKTFSLSFSSIIDPDFKVLPTSGKQIKFTKKQQNLLKNNDDIISYSAVIEEKVFLQFGDKNELATLKGVDKNYPQTVAIDSIIVAGQWLTPKTKQTITGFLLADKLEVGIFNHTKHLELFVPKPGLGQVDKNTFNKINTQNVGLFELNDEQDQQLIFTTIEASRELLKYDENTVSAIEIKTKPIADEAQFRVALQEILGKNVTIKNKLQQNDALHKMLNTENIAVYLIFTLILIIALFNVIGSIIMMIIAKKSDLKTMSNLGLPLADIKQIFFLQGALLTAICGVTGVFLGIIIISAQIYFEFIKIPGTNFAYPIELTLKNIALVLSTIFVLGLLASKIASYRISKKLID